MKIIAEIFSSNWETYKEFYKEAVIGLYAKNGVFVDEKDIAYRTIVISGSTIQSQRSPSSDHSRTISIYEVNDKGQEILRYIIGVSNTGYDEDKRIEGGNYVYGNSWFHSNSYLCQGVNKIFERYYKEKATDENLKLYFYLLDTKGRKRKTYPNSLSNILVYKMLYTIGFEIININDIDFSKWRNVDPHKDPISNLKYTSFNKLVNDITYVSHKNRGNKPAYVKCYEDDNKLDKYVYTFKALGANAYDSFLRIWALSILAEREGKNIEFLFAPEIYNFRLGQKNPAMTTDFPVPVKKLIRTIGLNITYETSNELRQQIDREKSQFETAKKEKNIRNQEYFKNNLREKGVLIKCCLCGCEVESILEAAHLWGVSEISNASDAVISEAFEACNIDYDVEQYSDDIFFKKYILANSGDNGVWLCRNHHGLFDKNHFVFDSKNGAVITQTDDIAKEYIEETAISRSIPEFVLTPATLTFLQYANRTRIKVLRE